MLMAMTNSDKHLSQKIAARLLAPAFAAFEAIAAGEVNDSHRNTLAMTMRLARLAGQHGVRVPAISEAFASVVATITEAFQTGAVAQLDDDQISEATQWLKAIRNQLGHARYSTLLALIDDLTLIAALQE